MRPASLLALPRDLVATVATAVVAASLVVTVDTAVVRLVPGLLLALVLPGYALSCVVLPTRRPTAERLLLALGLSLALTVVTGVVLDRLPSGLSRESWAAALGAETVVCALLAAVSRPPVASSPAGASEDGPRRDRRIVAGAVLALAAACGAAFLVARTPVASRAAQGYSVLWTRPVKAQANELTVGVVSYESRRASYRIVGLDAAGTFLDLRFELRPRERWAATATARVPSSFAESAQVILYRGDGTETAYRHVSLMLPWNSP